MKHFNTKILTLLLLLIFTSCKKTIHDDWQMLRNHYDAIYQVGSLQYITQDSTGKIFHVILNYNGDIRSASEIHQIRTNIEIYPEVKEKIIIYKSDTIKKTFTINNSTYKLKIK